MYIILVIMFVVNKQDNLNYALEFYSMLERSHNGVWLLVYTCNSIVFSLMFVLVHLHKLREIEGSNLCVVTKPPYVIELEHIKWVLVYNIVYVAYVA